MATSKLPKLRQEADEETGRDPLASLCEEIRACLENRRDRVCEELGNHPRPVAACDVHFNRLLEERTAVYRELERLEELRRAGAREDLSAPIEDFVLSSSCLEEEAKRSFGARLRPLRPAPSKRR
jgi:hypothetical protein